MLTKEQRDEIRRRAIDAAISTPELEGSDAMEMCERDIPALLDALDEMERERDAKLGAAIRSLRSQGHDYLQIGPDDILDIRSDRARELQQQMRTTITDAAEKAPR